MVATGMSSSLGFYAEKTAQEAGDHVEDVDEYCRRLEDATSERKFSVFDLLLTLSGKLCCPPRTGPDSHPFVHLAECERRS